MAIVEWVTVQTIWCDRIEDEARLLEQRVYPSEVLPDTAPFQVIARKCSACIDCNQAGYRCKWAFNNPDYDPFDAAH